MMNDDDLSERRGEYKKIEKNKEINLQRMYRINNEEVQGQEIIIFLRKVMNPCMCVE